MTGPKHFEMAQHFIEHSLNHTDTGNEADRHIATVAAAQAQVHATLALVAAVVESQGGAAFFGAPAGNTYPAVPPNEWAKAVTR